MVTQVASHRVKPFSERPLISTDDRIQEMFVPRRILGQTGSFLPTFINKALIIFDPKLFKGIQCIHECNLLGPLPCYCLIDCCTTVWHDRGVHHAGFRQSVVGLPPVGFQSLGVLVNHHLSIVEAVLQNRVVGRLVLHPVFNHSIPSCLQLLQTVSAVLYRRSIVKSLPCRTDQALFDIPVFVPVFPPCRVASPPCLDPAFTQQELRKTQCVLQILDVQRVLATLAALCFACPLVHPVCP
mmetsp:Transcript_80834/g.203279  ORF Transcript_80834/g.203279 Transcript_80834/m.203279 type:complete len:240 (-) Transcript_80834:265-984(-)